MKQLVAYNLINPLINQVGVIGEDQGYRSCIQVGDNDTCMSGDIFPSQEICVNPKLRA